MEKTRCRFCHEYIENDLLDAHIKNHQSLLVDGQQRDYVTLPPNERVDRELTDVPFVYIHTDCGVATVMPDEIVRSYLQNPYLYASDATFCAGCGKHVPFADCIWTETKQNLQEYFDALRAEKPECRPAGFKTKAEESASKGALENNKGSSISMMGIATAFAAIVGVSILAKIPGQLKKNADKQMELQVPLNQQAGQSDSDQWTEKINRGEDVPEAILMLAGISPEKYETHRIRLRSLEATKLEKQGLFADAIKALDVALEKTPEAELLHNGKAWILATCSDDAVRDGRLAVEHATKACELTEFEDPSYLDTLAASHAEAGNFESAIQQIQRAMELTTDEAQRQRFAARMDLYTNRKPFRK